MEDRLKRFSSIVPERIKMGREARGLTTREFAEMIGVSHQMISKYEKGQSIPGSQVLDKMVKELNLPFRFFLKTKKAAGEDKTVFFRSRAVSSVKLKKIHEIKLEWLKEIQYYLEDILDFPKVNFPNLINQKNFFQPVHFEEIDELAMTLRKFWNLNEGPISNLLLLLEKNGVIISKVNFSDIKIDACSEWDENGRPFILLGNNKQSSSRTRFDLAHELGHLILHRYIKKSEFNNKQIYKRIEEEADRFASAFLMPRSSFIEEFVGSSLDFFVLMKKRWKVSIQALVYRASDLGLISDYQKSYLWRQISSKGWRKSEPFEELIVEEPVVLKQAFELIINHEVKSKGQLVDDLSLNREDIEELSNVEKGFLLEFNEKPLEDNILNFKI
ncbi:ImmA/IrrE family metallo-endopeptidase [Bacillus haynesii]|uniref:helix-turn-helix domain-containing protein n=1 Tax=Bacillus haynesii TaxID=1925021 RepID=UPI00228326BB|nr:ImmA/IrrE family metallo-endopeptidase [Bacillus haynesii]MCY8579347.1 ImmA/IrrE family metallo-endopeptidase [Bacillus haynesii]